MSQPDRHHAALQDFFRWERQSWVDVVADFASDEKTPFMPVDTLRSYLGANGAHKLALILSEIFADDRPPINPEVILQGHTAVFCILLRIDKGRCIEHFACYEELSDQRLPFDPAHPPACFPAPPAGDDDRFLERFCEKQWMYCVPVFDNHMHHKHFARQRLLPITHRELRGPSGGSVAVYKVKLYPPHNRLCATRSSSPGAHMFALKRYHAKDGEDHYRREVNGYWTLRHPSSIISFYGSFAHGDTCNILLEYADKGSLEEFYEQVTPPSRGEDIVKFWDRLFQLIEALRIIHTSLGCHQDVRPATVLVLSYGADSPYDWQFKLADLGRSHAKGKTPSDGDLKAVEPLVTRTYGAPECYMPSHADHPTSRGAEIMTQAVDIWSLGCIYSEAAMWVADGQKGVLDYRRQRISEISLLEDFNAPKSGDCFHDGERMLTSVLDAHRDIEQRLRRADHMTKDVLEAMVAEMLWDEDRPSAKALWRKAEVVLERAQQKLASSSNGPVMTYSRPAPSLPQQSPPQKRSRPPRLPPLPPQMPLPPLPPHMPLQPPASPFPEERHISNVERWRSQVHAPAPSTRPNSVAASPTQQTHQHQARSDQIDSPTADNASLFDFERDLASWQGTGNTSPLIAPITPMTSPHTSLSQHGFGGYFDLPRTHGSGSGGEEPRTKPLLSQKLNAGRPSMGMRRRATNGSSERSRQSYAGTVNGGGPHSIAELSGSRQPYTGMVSGGGPHSIAELSGSQQSYAGSINGGGPHSVAEPSDDDGDKGPADAREQYVNLSDGRAPAMAPAGEDAERNTDGQGPKTMSGWPRPPYSPLNPNPVTLAPLIEPGAIKKYNNSSNNSPTLEYSSTVDNHPSRPALSPRSERRPAPLLSVFPPQSMYTTAANTSPPPLQHLPGLPATSAGPTSPTPPMTAMSEGQISMAQPESFPGSFAGPAFAGPASPSSGREPRASSSRVGEADYLTLAQALEWKHAHKLAKKTSLAPTLPGARRLDRLLRGRDHAFIVDDGATMVPLWPELTSAFAALTYILKPHAPDGLELFFAVAYNTWRRRNTSELCAMLDKMRNVRVPDGPTDISYRLKLQLQAYGTRVEAAHDAPHKKKAKDKASPRPLSLYILTSGAWKNGPGTDPIPHIKALSSQLASAGLCDARQITITFIRFGSDASGAQRVRSVVDTDFGLDIVDAVPATGNVLKMLCGVLDRTLLRTTEREPHDTTPSSSASTMILPSVSNNLNDTTLLI